MVVPQPDLVEVPSSPKTPHSISQDEVLRQLATPAESGLTAEEVARRQAVYGTNELAEAPPTSFWRMLWDQFNNFVVILLVVAALLAAILGDWIEAAAILAIVILNAGLGVIQERRAEQALAALRKLASPDAQVLRDGHRQVIPARELVPGDIVLLEAGNYVPADVRLLEAINLRIEEAALTGESVPVQKDASRLLQDDVPIGDRKNTSFMGTLVSYGRGRGVVVSTGMRTQIGRIAAMLQSVQEEPTPLQRRLDELGRTLGLAALVSCALVFIVGWVRGTDPLEMFLIAVSLAIAAVPEGLPAVVTISLALGMREMIKRNALIRRLASVETLGSATVIGSDKTGTLTQNEMTVTRLWVGGRFFSVTGAGYDPHGKFLLDGNLVDLIDYPAALTALWIAALNNDADLEVTGVSDMQQTYRVVGDPTEGALLVAALKAGASRRSLIEAYPRVQEVPFDSIRKRMATVHSVSDPDPDDISPFYNDSVRKWYVIAEKGAPDLVLDLCTHYQGMDDQPHPLDPAQLERILAATDQMTRDALRVLAVAYRVTRVLPSEITADQMEHDLVFVGLIGMIDPPRPEVRAALDKARRAGIRTLMITGDYPNTARAIAESVGLLRPGHKVVTGQDLGRMSDRELQRGVAHTDVFARVSPEHKVRIVEALQARAEVVAMTGDGVNDAPALKKADIGVAMGITGTDVAKETADMVLTDDNYASIVASVEQGRIIYSNIRKFVFFLLSSNVAEIMIIFLATLAGLPTPLTAIQLLWLNLITDGAPALALAMEAGDTDIMDQAPRPRDEPIINRPMRLGIAIQTISQTGVVLGAFALGLIWYLQSTQGIPAGVNPLLAILRFDWSAANVRMAETMAFATLSLCELFRAYTVRSERLSLFTIGVFSNRYMQAAVTLSILLLLLVVNVPFLHPVFNTTFLNLRAWTAVAALSLVPAVTEELTKAYLRRARQIRADLPSSSASVG